MSKLNLFGKKLETCSTKPLTGAYRNGCCETGPNDIGTHTVCAIVTDSRKEVRIAKILHYLSKENNKSSLKSFFWLGEELNHPNAIINMLLRFLSNFHYIKGFFINDKLARDLLTHCYEEMDHLSKFLPGLYSDLGIEQKSKELDIPL